MEYSRRYGQLVAKSLHPYRANWLPTKSVEIGDFGYLSDGLFKYRSNLKFRNITLPESTPKRSPRQDLKFSFGCDVTFESDFDEKGLGQEITAELNFNKKNALYFDAQQASSVELKDVQSLGEQLIALTIDKKWNDDWWVVVGYLDCKSFSIVVPSSASAKAKANAKISGPEEDKVVTLNGRLSSQSNVELGLYGKDGGRPLLKLMRVKPKFFGGHVVVDDFVDPNEHFDMDCFLNNSDPSLAPGDILKFTGADENEC